MFYIFGALSLLWGLLWFVFARESPDKMTWIKSDELAYIESKVVTVDQKSKKIPFKNICLSLPYWVSFNSLTIFRQLFLGPCTLMKMTVQFSLRPSILSTVHFQLRCIVRFKPDSFLGYRYCILYIC